MFLQKEPAWNGSMFPLLEAQPTTTPPVCLSVHLVFFVLNTIKRGWDTRELATFPSPLVAEMFSNLVIKVYRMPTFPGGSPVAEAKRAG